MVVASVDSLLQTLYVWRIRSLVDLAECGPHFRINNDDPSPDLVVASARSLSSYMEAVADHINVDCPVEIKTASNRPRCCQKVFDGVVGRAHASTLAPCGGHSARADTFDAVSVAVTIDVEHPCRPAPDPILTLRTLIETARRFDQPISWFVQGRWASAYPQMIDEFIARGDLVGLHGYSHVDSRRLTRRGLEQELEDGLRALMSAAPGLHVEYCRLPYGQGTDRHAVRSTLEDFSLKPVGWDYSSFDWDETLSDEKSATRLTGAIATGGVTLMHSWPRRAPLVLGTLLERLGESRASLVSDLKLPAFGSQGWRVHAELLDLPRI